MESLTALDADRSKMVREIEWPVFCLIVSRAEDEVLNDIPYSQKVDVKRTTCMICDLLKYSQSGTCQFSSRPHTSLLLGRPLPAPLEDLAAVQGGAEQVINKSCE